MLKMFINIYNMSGKEKHKFIISFFLQFFDTFLQLFPLGCLLIFLEKYTTNTLNNNLYIQIFILLLVSIIVRSISRFYMDKTQYSVIYSVFYGERIRVTEHLKKLNMGFFTNDNIGKVTTTLINGLSFIEEKCMDSLLGLFTACINLAFITIFLFIMNNTLGIIYLCTLIIVYIFLIPYKKQYEGYSKTHNKSDEILTGAIIEYVKNISVIKAFNLLGKHKRINDAYTNKRKVDLKGEYLNVPFITGVFIINSISVGIMLYYVCTNYNDFILYNAILLIIFALFSFRALEVMVLKLGIIYIANDSLNNIKNLYDEPILKVNNDLKPNGYDIEFNNVEFAYNNTNVIDNISFKLKANTMNALVGLSGSGKTTLVNLIPRFFDNQKGSIKIGEVDIKDMSSETLNSCISMVFQNVYLFNDTIYNNIVFGNTDATKQQVYDACKKARCYDFIMALPNGFDTMVIEGGMSLSGGERQRLSIARAILKDSPIILLDEATASVDPDNELDIQLAINALVQDKTLLVIAHKLSCVTNASKILVIDNGKLIDEGTHTELLNKEGLYSNLWNKRVHSKSWEINNT